MDSEAVEALAEVWASMDNRLERFLANKADRSLDLTDGSYPGYLADAECMLEQLEELGFRLARMPGTAQD